MNKKSKVENIISGDIKAFEKLFYDLYDGLAYCAFQYLKDKDAAEDIVQELFSKLWINREQLTHDTNIQAYLYSAVKNACLNQIKHQKVKEAYLLTSVFPLQSVDQIESKMDAAALDKLIQNSIFELPTERQKIFLLSRRQGLKYHEIADKLGISVKTVEAQMGKALRFLRERLKDYLVLIIVFLMGSIN